MNKKHLLIVPFILLFQQTFSQSFTKVDNIDFKSGYLGYTSWCDYNADGFLDIFVTGQDFGVDYPTVEIYKNNGDKTFTRADIVYIPRVIYGDISWGDFNNDGFDDFIYAGTVTGSSENNITRIYKNVAGNNFEPISNPIPKLGQCYLEWVDVNNDGLLDIYYQGITSEKEFDLGLYKNNGDATFEKVPFNFKKVSGPRGNFTKNSAKWADFDNDGYKDVIIAMATANGFEILLLKNNGEFDFSEINTGIPNLNYVSMDVGDVNNDDLIDIVLSGSYINDLSYSDGNGDIYIFRNNGNLNFSQLSKIYNVGVFKNNLELGDFNNDDALDIIYYGAGSGNRDFKMYTNNGNGAFLNFSHSIIQSGFGMATFGDFDNDEDLDILYTGRIYSPYDQEVLYVYENNQSALSVRDNLINTRKIKIYPVPIKDELHIDFENKSNIAIKIYDVKGSIISQEILTEKNNLIPFKNIKSGVYFMHLKGETYTKVVKLIK